MTPLSLQSPTLDPPPPGEKSVPPQIHVLFSKTPLGTIVPPVPLSTLGHVCCMHIPDLEYKIAHQKQYMEL